MLSALVRDSVGPLLPDFVRPWTALRGTAREFQRKIPVDFKVRDYRVKTVESPDELKLALALRRSVFHYEFAGKKLSLRSDQDAFDAQADHLAIFDEKAGVVVGVYRLISSAFTRNFYSNTEFAIDGFLAAPGAKLELSRACIARDYRNGVVISLLWKGIADYARKANVDFLFGLSSIATASVTEIAGQHRYFIDQGLVADDYGIQPRPDYAIADFSAALARHGASASEPPQVPPLFKSYLKAGAKICSQPVIDRAFSCADWLTVLNMRALAGTYDKKYMRT